MKRLLFVCSLSGLMAGCVNRDLEVQPSVVPDATFQNAGGPLGQVESEDAWWESFGDPQLTHLMDMAQEHNRSLVASRAQVRMALEKARQAGAGLWPSLGVGGQAGSQETLIDPDGLSQAASLGIGAEWKIDLFGQEQNKREAARALAYSREDELDGSRMAVLSATVSTYLTWQNVSAREVVLRESIAIAERSVAVAEGFFREGMVSDFEVQHAKSRMAATQALLPELLSAKERLHNALAVLVGVRPSALDLKVSDPVWPLVTAPVIPAVAPSTVLLKRPDVRAARRKVQAQMYAVGAAKAAYYPTFNLQMIGQYQFLHFSVPHIPNQEGPVSAFSLDAVMPLFAAGRIDSAVRGEQAKLDAATALYENTILQALADVETAYKVFAEQRKRKGLLNESARSAVAAAERAAGLYEAGSINLIDWLQVQGNRQKQLDEALQAELDYLVAAVELHDALGGF